MRVAATSTSATAADGAVLHGIRAGALRRYKHQPDGVLFRVPSILGREEAGTTLTIHGALYARCLQVAWIPKLLLGGRHGRAKLKKPLDGGEERPRISCGLEIGFTSPAHRLA
jgi:hypothetical protein